MDSVDSETGMAVIMQGIVFIKKSKKKTVIFGENYENERDYCFFEKFTTDLSNHID